MKPKYYYIKERYNPQFKKPYYVSLGQISQRDAKKYEDTLYGYNIIHRFETKKAHDEAMSIFKKEV